IAYPCNRHLPCGGADRHPHRDLVGQRAACKMGGLALAGAPRGADPRELWGGRDGSFGSRGWQVVTHAIPRRMNRAICIPPVAPPVTAAAPGQPCAPPGAARELLAKDAREHHYKIGF